VVRPPYWAKTYWKERKGGLEKGKGGRSPNLKGGKRKETVKGPESARGKLERTSLKKTTRKEEEFLS